MRRLVFVLLLSWFIPWESTATELQDAGHLVKCIQTKTCARAFFWEANSSFVQRRNMEFTQDGKLYRFSLEHTVLFVSVFLRAKDNNILIECLADEGPDGKIDLGENCAQSLDHPYRMRFPRIAPLSPENNQAYWQERYEAILKLAVTHLALRVPAKAKKTNPPISISDD